MGYRINLLAHIDPVERTYFDVVQSMVDGRYASAEKRLRHSANGYRPSETSTEIHFIGELFTPEQHEALKRLFESRHPPLWKLLLSPLNVSYYSLGHELHSMREVVQSQP